MDQLEKVKKELQCVIHMEIRKGPIYSCGENCHLLCQNCLREIQSRDNKCPMCRVDLSINPSRNYAIERTIAQLELPEDCPNCAIGCMFRGKQEEVERHHMNECQFTPVFCPDIRCQKVLPLNGLLNHIEEYGRNSLAHYVYTRKFEGNVIIRHVHNGYRSAHVMFPLEKAKWQEHTIFPMIYKKGNIYHIWMYLLGDKDAADRFPVITISLEGLRSTVMIKTRVFSVRIGLKDVLRDVDALLTLTNSQVWQCVHWTPCTKKLQVKYEIIQETPATEEVAKDTSCFHSVFKDPSLRIHTRGERIRLKEVVDGAVKKTYKVGETWYFIYSRWFGEMYEYLKDLDGSRKARHPGPIDNDYLFMDLDPWRSDRTGEQSLLSRDIDSKYEFIAEEGWNELVQSFGFR